MPQKVNGEPGRGLVPSPGATALRAVDEEEVPKESIFYPEEWGEGFHRVEARIYPE